MPNRPHIGASYDRAADVLYLYLNDDAYTRNMEEEAGLILRYDENTDAPMAVTVVDYKEYWLSKQDRLAIRLADFFGVRVVEAKRVLRKATEKNA